ncbi:ATP-binding cassette domain-containing protein [Granulimonas faecalis]|uniref:ATP-binding cassette domain-containing protein n=1 Tax=Granulimonas faecalis TaxID=2894155 RepID=UPI0035171064
MRQLGSFFHIAMNGMAASEKIFRLLDADVPADGTLPVPDEGPIVARGLSFTYPGAEGPTLRDLDIEVPRGSFTAVVGRSGSGKSTLLKLFMRFWDVQGGSMAVSGTEVADVDTDNLRDLEGYMTQDTHLFHDSIRNNLRIARLDATDEEIEAACRAASVHDFIAGLPQGYDTPVGELGDTLSGGERQRLGLARAFLHDAPFLLLDEPTSNLDSLNEAQVLKSLAEGRDGRTVLLVSHRESTMRVADRVFSVEDGRLS